MSAIPIIIPSAGRADAVLTKIAGAILYVPEAEAAAYHQHNPGVQIIKHGHFRNLAAKRQAIYAQWGDCFMVDDDIAFVRRLYLPADDVGQYLTPEETAELIQITAANARAAGCRLFGFSSRPDPMHYQPHRPIRLTTYINASAFGLLRSDKLYFTERTTAAESHWINLLNAVMHRKSWCDTRFCFAQANGSTFFRPGGQTAHRTLASELADTLFLRRMFGQAVQVKRSKAATAVVHPYQRTIANPL